VLGAAGTPQTGARTEQDVRGRSSLCRIRSHVESNHGTPGPVMTLIVEE